MNAAETIQAAINRLEKYKAESTSGPWFTTYERSRWLRIWGNGDGDHADAVAQTEGGTGNAPLIVTLHRTIDAQLGILRGVLRVHQEIVPLDFDDEETWPIPAWALALAKAILGEVSS